MRLLLAILLAALAGRAAALDPAAVERLVFGDAEERTAAIAALVKEGDPRAVPLLEALAEGELQVAGKRILIVKGEEATDALSGAKLAALPAEREDVVANNRLRREIAAALAAFKLLAPEREARLEAARALAGGADPAFAALVKRALEKETDPDIRALLELTAASMELKSGGKEERLAAIRRLGGSGSPASRTLLAEAANDSDEDIRGAARSSLREVQGRLAWASAPGCCSPA